MKNISSNISGVTTSQVNYKGSVKVLYVDRISGKSKITKRYNNGGPGLFTAICRMLAGLSVNNYLPASIMGYNNDDDKVFTKPFGYASAPILYKSSDIATEDDADNIQYTFMIPATNIDKSKGNITKLVLSNNRNQTCATLDLTNEPINTNSSSNILIYWKLKFA